MSIVAHGALGPPHVPEVDVNAFGQQRPGGRCRRCRGRGFPAVHARHERVLCCESVRSPRSASRRSSAVLISAAERQPVGQPHLLDGQVVVRSRAPKMSLISSFTIAPVRMARKDSDSATAMRAATSLAASPRPGRARTRKRQPSTGRKSTGTRKRACRWRASTRRVWARYLKRYLKGVSFEARFLPKSLENQCT